MPMALLAPIGGGVISALLYLSVLTGGLGALILAYLAPLPLLLVGLGIGVRASLVAGAVSVLVVGLAGGVVLALTYAVSNVALVAIVVRQALLARTAPDGSLEWYPPGLLLTILTGLGLGVLGLAAALTMGEPGGLEGAVRDMLGTMFGQVLDVEPGGPAAVEPMVESMAPVFPGVVVVSWLTMTIINAALAQGLLMRFGRNLRPPMRMADVELPRWVPIAFAIAAAGAVLLPGTLGYLAINAAMILALAFCFAGLAVVHAFAQARSARTMMLVLFYCFLLLFGWPILMVFGLGVIEQWVGLRRRFNRTGPDQED